VSASPSASDAALVTLQVSVSPLTGDVGEIAIVGAVGAVLATVTELLAKAVPAPEASLGVTLTTTTSPFPNDVTPLRELLVAPLTTVPLTYHTYASVTLSPSASLLTTFAVIVSFVRTVLGDNVTLVTTGAVLVTVAVSVTAAPLSLPSVGVTVQAIKAPTANGPVKVDPVPDVTPLTVQR
jgi:hypothetical protein